MIKSVISSIPMYYMSLIKMPKGIIGDIEKIVRRFLWGGSDLQKKLHMVDWDTVTKPKMCGGLGICNFEIQNQALLFKWLWRYGNEGESLWRQVIDARLGMRQKRLIPCVDNSRRTSFIWRNISQVLSPPNKFNNCVSDLCISVGDGNTASFWIDDWSGEGSLKEAFPRIYQLAINKEGVVNEFGRWQDNVWIWEVPLRRSVFNWEMQQWDSFMGTLNMYFLDCDRSDKLIWKASTSGAYSVKSFYNKICGQQITDGSLWKTVWAGIGPPKVEIFVWQVMRGRVAVKAELARRGLMMITEAKCPLCGCMVETISHLFFHCTKTWKIWMHFLSFRELQWCCPGDPISFLQSWIGMFSNASEKPWCMLFLAIIWSIWLFRNEVVFKEFRWDHIQVMNLIKTRFAFWTKAKWPDICCSFDDLFQFPVIPLNMVDNSPARTVAVWCKPCEGVVKFNVDGSSLGKPGPAGIGGILRDKDGSVLAVFSKSIGEVESNMAEFMAVREAFLIFVNSKWSLCSLIVESDSINAVNWVNNPVSIPWRLNGVANHLSCLKKRVRDWHCLHVFREANEEADILAKQGVNRSTDLLWFADSGTML